MPKREYTIEDGGFRINNLEKRRARSRCMMTSLVICVALVVGACVMSEMFRYETTRAIHQVATTMRDRDSICLSSLHVGRTDYRIVVLSELPNEPGLVLMNPSIYQLFGKTTRTQELAHPPTQCYTTRKKAYSIHRDRRESISMTFMHVNTSNPLWPSHTLVPSLTKVTKTFNGMRSYCLQHVMELFNLQNVCDELEDRHAEYERRLEL